MQRPSRNNNRVVRIVQSSEPYNTRMNSGGGSNRVYVGNLDYSVSWQDLKDHMRQAGKVTHADILQEDGGRSKGCGIVEFASAREAQKAIDMLNDTDLNNRQIFVREDREAGKNGSTRISTTGREPSEDVISRTLIVENIPDSFAWQELKDLLKPVGPVNHADIKERDNGSRIGVVEFRNKEDVQKAINQSSSLCVEYDEDMLFRLMYRADIEDVTGWKSGNGKGSGSGSELFRKLFVNNLGYSVSWQDLKDHFRSAGEVIRADIATEDGASARSKGFGFVEFNNTSDAAKAVRELNGSYLKGRQIFVREYREDS
jgi:RNA recognition motif-containing protein